MQGFSWEFKKEVLPNGITLWTLEAPWINFFQYRFLFERGSLDNPVGLEGLFHLFEHQMVKVCSQPIGNVPQYFLSKGCYINAHTALDHICVWGMILDVYRDELEPLMWEVITTPDLSQHLEEEKQIILRGEIAVSSAKPQLRHHQAEIRSHLIGELAYQGIAESVLGTEESLAKVGAEDMHATWSQTRQALSHVIIAGRDLQSVRDKIAQLPAYSGCRSMPLLTMPKNSLFEVPYSRRELGGEIDPSAEVRAHWVMPARNWREWACQKVIATVLDSECIRTLRTEWALAYHVDVGGSSVIPMWAQRHVAVKLQPKDVGQVAEYFQRHLSSDLPASIDNILAIKQRTVDENSRRDYSVLGFTDGAGDDLEKLREPCPPPQYQEILKSLTLAEIVSCWENCFRDKYQLITILP